MFKIRILILIAFILTSMTAFANDVRAVDVHVGVSQAIPILSKVLKTPKYNFFLESDGYNLRLANKLITKEVIIAFLPPEYTLKAVWTSDDLDIVGKASPHYLYLVGKGKNKNVSKETIKNKKILLLENSADEFYLKKYLEGVQYQKIAGTALEQMNSLKKNDEIDFVLIDSLSYFALKKSNPELNALKIEGGVYYTVMLMRENEILFNPISREIFKKNNIPYFNLTKNDLLELKDLNDFLVKNKLSQQRFEVLFSGLMQR